MNFIKTVSLFLILTSCSNTPNCLDIQTGTFDINDKKNGVHTIIERNEHYQIETNVDNGDKTKASVRWRNDCTYVLKYLETDVEILKPLIGSELTIEITKIEGRKVYFSASAVGYDEKPSFFMTMID